jgi:hypothetical protein
MRRKYDLGSKAPRKEIEEHWESIRADWRDQSPCSVPLCFSEMLLSDDALSADFERIWKVWIHPSRRRGFHFDEVLPTAVFIIFWRVMKCAHEYQKLPLVPRHGWANRYWYDKSLRRELDRAIDAMADAEREERMAYLGGMAAEPLAQPIGDLREDNQVNNGQRHAFDREDDPDFIRMIETLRPHLKPVDLALFEDWCSNSTLETKDAIAERHGRSVTHLNGLLRNAATILTENIHPEGGDQ